MLQSLDKFIAETKALLKTRNYAEAQLRLDSLLGKFPRHPDILFMSGACQVAQDNHGPGIALLERAMEMGCQHHECFSNLANAYRAENNLEMAEFFFRIAMDRPNPPADLYANMATLHVNESRAQQAIELCDKAIVMEPSHGLARFNRSLAYLEEGRWQEGFADYHRYSFGRSNRSERNYSLPNRSCPEWDGTSGQTVATWGEQGIGDELMFASCIPDLIDMSKEVIVECDPRLEALFRRSFPCAVVYGTTDQDQTSWPWHHSIDASIAMGGLPQFFRKSVQDFPTTSFLKADEWQIGRWKKLFNELPGSGPVVVVSWIGGLKQTRVEQRSIALSEWGPILSQPCRFVSLQWQKEAEQEAEAYGIITYPEAIQYFDLGASLVAAADLVISVANTNVHLAGGLGKSCICLTPFNPPWPFCYRGGPDRNVWYDSVTHVRQKTRGEWGPVIQDVADHLQRMMAHREAAE